MMPRRRLSLVAAILIFACCQPSFAQPPGYAGSPGYAGQGEYLDPAGLPPGAFGESIDGPNSYSPPPLEQPPVVYEPQEFYQATPPYDDMYAQDMREQLVVEMGPASAWLPAVDEPWDARRWTIGPFVGVAFGDEVITDQVKFDDGLYTGLRIARAYDDRFTTEFRLAYGRIDVYNLQGEANTREGEVFIGGSSLVFSPRVGPRLRPFISAGGGFAHLDFTDQNGTIYREFVPAFSPGAGLEYRVTNALQLRLDVRDQILFGRATGLETMNHLTVAAALEYRFGARPVFYEAL